MVASYIATAERNYGVELPDGLTAELVDAAQTS